MQIDRYGVDASKAVEDISRQLLEHEIITEGYGGEVPIVPVRQDLSNAHSGRLPRDAYLCVHPGLRAING